MAAADVDAQGGLQGLRAADGRLWDRVARGKHWVALAFFLLNVALKLPFLGGSSLFLDEAVAIYETQGSPLQTIVFSSTDPTPPLYYLTLGLWTKVFGISEASARFPSMLFSAATAALLFLVGLRHFNARAGVFAASFFTVSAVGMVFAHEARSYALAGMLMVLSYGLFLDLARAGRPTWRLFLGLAMVNALLLYTHYLTALGLASQGLMALWLLRGKARSLLAYAGAQAAALSLWLPWFAYNRSLMPATKVTSWLRPPTGDQLHFVLINFAGSKFLMGYGLALIVIGVVAAAIVFARRNRPEWGGFALVVAGAWFALSLGLQYVVAREVIPIFDLRYVLYTLPGGLLFIGAALSYLPLPRVVQYVLAGTFIVASAAVLKLDPQKIENWRDAVAAVKEMADDRSGIVVTQHYQYVSFGYYYNQDYFRDLGQITHHLRNDNVHFGTDSLIIPKIDGREVTNVILVMSQDNLIPGQKQALEFMKSRYCIARRGAFSGIKVYKFQLPPCAPDPGGHFVEDYEGTPKAGETDRILALPDSANPANHVTFVGPGHEFSASKSFRSADIYGGHFSAAELKFKGFLQDAGKKVMLVFVQEHEGEPYNWTGLEMQQTQGAGVWFRQQYQVLIPEVRDPEDLVKAYFWSPDGGRAQFDSLEVDFWQGE